MTDEASVDKPYRQLVDGYAALVGAAPESSPPAEPAPPASPADDATTLLFSPHPDDECIVGALPLRLRRERGWRVVNVAVTLGSDAARRAARWQELRAACDHLDFELLAAADGGLQRINAAARRGDAAHWADAVRRIAAILSARRPRLILFPHAADANRTHIGTHLLLLDALARTPHDFCCDVAETEFWSPQTAPNLLLESSRADVADLVTALALHRGEVARNPYHLRLPAWMIDNVRRAAEQVIGQGAAAPDFTFATAYRLRRWADGRLHDDRPAGRCVGAGDSLTLLFASAGDAIS